MEEELSIAPVDECVDEGFLQFKNQLMMVQYIVELNNKKILDKTLCEDDLTCMDVEMESLNKLEKRVSAEKIRPSYIPYKVLSLQMVQESFRICNWLLEKKLSDMDNKFNINSYFELIFKSCADKENISSHIDNLFNGVFKNTSCFNLSFYGNVKSEAINEQSQVPQMRKEYRKSQKRPLEDQVVPDEVENGADDNELQVTLLKVTACLNRAVSKNNGNPVSFYKFAIDPFSLTYTVQNLFLLALLVKDRHIKIKINPDANNDMFTTITTENINNANGSFNNRDSMARLFTMNNSLWKYYIEKYNITERMIDQDE